MNNLEIIGKYYGYPSCCIKAYVGAEKDIKTITNLQLKITKQQDTGFMPCHQHCIEISDGRMRIENLITARICPLPFPQSPPYETIKEYLVGEIVK